MSFDLAAQRIVMPVDAFSLGITGNSVVRTDAFCIWNNPAATSILEQSALVIAHSRFDALPECANSAIGYARVRKNIGYQFGIRQYGFEAFHQTSFTMGMSRKLGKRFSLGLNLVYLRTDMAEYGSTGTWLGQVGMHLQLNPKVTIAFQCLNPSMSKVNGVHDPRYSFLNLGIQYRVSKQVRLSAELVQHAISDLSYGTSICVAVNSQTSLFAGWSVRPQAFGTGASVKSRFGSLQCSLTFQHGLGYTPAVSGIVPIEKEMKQDEK